MNIDLTIVIFYFAAIMVVALRGKVGKEATIEQYFMSSRNLRWPSIALSTIATNVQGYQFLGMMGSAYLYGLAQANLEINAIQGLLMAAFIFVPLYLKEKIITITQFIKKRMGRGVALAYSVANLVLLSTVGLGAALFWGAYAADLVFADYLTWISDSRITRILVLVVFLGVFSATYTYFGGLGAVVKTDIIQFFILLVGGITVLLVAVHELGGWGQLYAKTRQLMHLHLPKEHKDLPWIAIGGMFLLNINYWCANQSVVQRSLAARSLKEAQVGLMVGGVLKVLMGVVIVVPGIALFGILDGTGGLAEPDQAFPYLVTTYLPLGVRGLILCALFASLMSTVDSLYNSLATLWSIDIYQEYLRPQATEQAVVRSGRRSILVTLVSGIVMGWVLLWVKFKNPEAAFTHTLNELRYYINCGIVVIICGAAFLLAPKHRAALAFFFSTIPLQLLFKELFPEMNYFVRAMWVIVLAFGGMSLWGGGFRRQVGLSASPQLSWLGVGLLGLLAILHLVFH